VTGDHDPELLDKVKSGTFKSVLSVAAPEEDLRVPVPQLEEETKKALGGSESPSSTFRNVPVTPSTLYYGVAHDVAAALGELPKPVLVHCRGGVRAAAAAAIGLLTEGDEETASAELSRIPGRSDLIGWVDRFRRSREVADALEVQTESTGLVFRQLFDRESCTYTYLLACAETREGVLIDPVLEQIGRDLQEADDLGIKILYALNTHVHADHITSSGCLKEAVPGLKSVLGSRYAEKGVDAKADVLVGHGEKIHFGNKFLEVRHTPGHTAGCVTYVTDDLSMAFTGDALLIRGSGRTDFQGGDSKELFRSIWKEILSLPDGTAIFPGHDYSGRLRSSVKEEKMFNQRVNAGGEEAFAEVLSALAARLPKPKHIEVAVPANLRCGLEELPGGDLRCSGCQGA